MGGRRGRHGSLDHECGYGGRDRTRRSAWSAFRGLAQGQFGRFGLARGGGEISGAPAYQQPYGVLTPGQMYGMKFVRWMHEHGGVGLDAQKAVSLASYAHAQNNPRATMCGKPLTSEQYDRSRMIVEPWRLYDFCQENDGAAAVILMPADRAANLPNRAAHILACSQGAYASAGRLAFNESPYASAGFLSVAPRLWAQARLGPADVDVVQSYENFTGGVVMSLVEHGLCRPEEVDEVLTLENLSAPNGRLPLNTSGGNLAEAYIHGFNLAIEGVRQLRGSSPNQVRGLQRCAGQCRPTDYPGLKPASRHFGGTMTDSRPAYLLPERVRPVPLPDGLDASFWEGLRKEQIVLQHCRELRDIPMGSRVRLLSVRGGQPHLGGGANWRRWSLSRSHLLLGTGLAPRRLLARLSRPLCGRAGRTASRRQRSSHRQSRGPARSTHSDRRQRGPGLRASRLAYASSLATRLLRLTTAQRLGKHNPLEDTRASISPPPC